MGRFAGVARAVAILTAMTLPTCGGEVSNRGPFSSGLPGDEVLSDLSPADKEHLCESGRAYQRDAGGCKYKAISAASLAHSLLDEARTEAGVRQACADAQSRCEAGPSSDTTGAPCQAPVLVSPCAATVREYEACVTEELAMMREATAASHDCSELTLADVEVSTSEVSSPGNVDISSGPACQTLADHCSAR